MFKYQELIEILSIEEVDATIKRMVNNYDQSGRYHEKEKAGYYIYSGELLLKKYFNLSPEFLKLMDDYAKKECDEIESGGLHLFTDTIEKSVEHQRDKIYCSLMNYLESKAKMILDNREHLRIPVGATIDFKDCMLSNKYLGKVEFYKDGGWGIAEEDGTVLVKNHLTRKPSETPSLSGDIFSIISPYRIIQDRDTNKFGILSYESFQETLHCIYEKIEGIGFYEGSKQHFFIKAMKNKKWGCFDQRCALIIDFNYDVIRLASGFLECIREAEYLLNDSLSDNEKRYEIEGKRDLFDDEGTLLLGGYDNLFVGYKYFEFYFGSSYKYYEAKETDLQGFSVPLSKVYLSFEKSICLVLDKEFRTLINNGNGFFRMPKWHKFYSPEQVERFVPSGCLFKSANVDLSDCDVFIYLYNCYREQYIVPDYIKMGFATPEEYYIFEASQINNYNEIKENLQNLLDDVSKEPNIDKPFDYSETTESFGYPYQNSKDLFVDDSVVTIMKLNDKREIVWTAYANEIVEKVFSPHIYRKGDKYGVFDWNGLKPAVYDAITRDSPDNNIYAASFEYVHECNHEDLDNPNYIYERRLYIHYYLLDVYGNYTKVEDDWKVFNPLNYKWFPDDFTANYYGYDEGPSGYCENSGHEWTDEDAWDAMTDGMYGDYPGSGWDPEAFGY